MDVPLFEGEHKETCNVCFGRGTLLCCDYCSLSYHPHCSNPPILSQPEDYWMCPQCVEDLSYSMIIVMHEYIDNGKETIQMRCKGEGMPDPMEIDYSLESRNDRSERVHIKFSFLKVIRCRGENGNKKGHIFTSGFRGVYSRGDKWNAQIQYNGKKVV